MAAEKDALKSMVLSFRVAELQMLLGFAGRNKSGRKTELQARAVELLRLNSIPIQVKIKDLYKLIQQGTSPGSGMTVQQPIPSPPHKETPPMAHNNAMQQQQLQQQSQSSMVYNPSGYSSQTPHSGAPRPTMYNPGMYHHQQQSHHYQTKPTYQLQQNYPVHPDVRLKKLPFSEVIAELLKPSSLLPQSNNRSQEIPFVFHLTPGQATQVAGGRDTRVGSKVDYAYQIQMRFCLLETSCNQDDCFPPGIGVKVNSKAVLLPNPIPTNKPGVEPKRPPRPVNITPYSKLSPTVSNHAAVTWTAEFGRGYVVAIYLVRKLTSMDLLHQLTKKGARHADFTRGLIKEKLNEDADCEIATTSLRVSLACPLGKMRMATPCRATTCQHLQCFDASLYLQMNEKKPTWNCPVCDKPALYDNLVIDGYFQQVLSSGKLSGDGNEVQLHQDGTWTAMYVKKEATDLCVTPSAPVRVVPKIETLDDDDFPAIISSKDDEPKKPAQKADVIDLTCSDSEDEAEVVSKKQATSKPDSSNRQSDSSTSASSSSTSTAGGSVTSSGYMSPSVITLDSPSPPVTPVPQSPSNLMRPPSYYPMSFLDLEDSNSPQPPGLHSSLFPRY